MVVRAAHRRARLQRNRHRLQRAAVVAALSAHAFAVGDPSELDGVCLLYVVVSATVTFVSVGPRPLTAMVLPETEVSVP